MTKLEPITGDITPEERLFHASGILCADALLVPDSNIPEGKSWTVDGRVFHQFLDPALRARPHGTVTLERVQDQQIQGRSCRQLRLTGGRLRAESVLNACRRHGWDH